MAETSLSYKDDSRAYTKEFALSLDAQDPLSSFRSEFIIPSKKDLKRKTLAIDEGIYMHTYCTCVKLTSSPLTYLCDTR